ncbi:MAG: hypothetical protein JNL58_01345 [Planctomyces sp.]|nr:hypothetical protein [Planctomyces sp.]
MSRSKKSMPHRKKRAWGTSEGTAGKSSSTGSTGTDLTPAEYGRMLLRENRPGRIGFSLSVLQLLGHIAWFVMVQSLVNSGEAKQLTSEDSRAWVIIGLLGGSTFLTITSMFICLYFGLRRSPRLLPLMGLGLSFFTGSFVTFLILLG